MSSSDTENTNKDDNKSSKVIELKIKDMHDIKDLNTENLYEYIEYLHSLVKKQDKKLKRYKNKINQLIREINKLEENRKEHRTSQSQIESLGSDDERKKPQMEDVKEKIETKQNSSS